MGILWIDAEHLLYLSPSHFSIRLSPSLCRLINLHKRTNSQPNSDVVIHLQLLKNRSIVLLRCRFNECLTPAEYVYFKACRSCKNDKQNSKAVPMWRNNMKEKEGAHARVYVRIIKNYHRHHRRDDDADEMFMIFCL